MFSVIIPAFNEEEAITDTIVRIKKIIEQIGDEKSEIIVVNDGSNDNTAQMAATAGAIVINQPHNIGYGKSLKTGILAAENDTIIITDSDGTYPIEEIPELLNNYI